MTVNFIVLMKEHLESPKMRVICLSARAHYNYKSEAEYEGAALDNARFIYVYTNKQTYSTNRQ